MTAKEKVLKVWPDARVLVRIRGRIKFFGIVSKGIWLQKALYVTEEAAWQNAAESLPAKAAEKSAFDELAEVLTPGGIIDRVAEPKPTPSTPTEPIEDSARIEAKIRSKIVMDGATPEDWIWETLAVLEAENRLFDIQPASISRAAEPKPTPSTPAAKLLFCPWEQCRTTGECQFPEECSANDFYIAHLENQLKPQPASISSEAEIRALKSLLQQSLEGMDTCYEQDHPELVAAIKAHIGAAAKGSTDTEGR